MKDFEAARQKALKVGAKKFFLEVSWTFLCLLQILNDAGRTSSASLLPNSFIPPFKPMPFMKLTYSFLSVDVI